MSGSGGTSLPPSGLPDDVRNEPAKRARGVPSGMSKICPEYLVPDLSAAHVFLRKEPDEDEEDEDDGEKDGDDNEDNSNDDGEDEGYSP
jgi:hypothetical protein